MDKKIDGAFLNSILENIPDMIFVKDAEELRFVRFNKAGEELLGYSKEELLGKNDYDFFSKPEADAFTQKDREVLKNGKLLDIPEEPIHTRTKGLRYLHTKKIPVMDENGKPLFLLGISEDITEKKKLEQQILEISDREQRRIGQDLHDGLGQHLTGISFLIKGLAKKLAHLKLKEADDADELARLVNEAISQTRDLARLLYPVDLDENGLFAALNVLAARTKDTYGISCDLSVPKNLIVEDDVQVSHLYRIAQEALSNAVKHAIPSLIKITLLQSNGEGSLSIVDDGEGFDECKLSKRGLGIFIMEQRAKMLGGNLKIHSVLKKGTEVVCTFPLNKE